MRPLPNTRPACLPFMPHLPLPFQRAVAPLRPSLSPCSWLALPFASPNTLPELQVCAEEGYEAVCMHGWLGTVLLHGRWRCAWCTAAPCRIWHLAKWADQERGHILMHVIQAYNVAAVRQGAAGKTHSWRGCLLRGKNSPCRQRQAHALPFEWTTAAAACSQKDETQTRSQPTLLTRAHCWSNQHQCRN